GAKAAAQSVVVVPGDDGDLPGLRPGTDPLGLAGPGVRAGWPALLAAGGMLPEHAERLRRLRRGAGALGSLAGQRGAGADPADHLQRRGAGRDPVADPCAARGTEPAGLWRRAAGGAGFGGGGVGASADGGGVGRTALSWPPTGGRPQPRPADRTDDVRLMNLRCGVNRYFPQERLQPR